MSRDITTESNRSLEDELPTGITINTQMFLDTCVLDANHYALKEHLFNYPVQQSDLDRCLLSGLRIVQRDEKELSHVAPALTILLQYGAKWNSDVLLDDHKTPYHIICESIGDYHELLDMMIKTSDQTIIDTIDNTGSTAIWHAVKNANINCLKCLIAHRADVNLAGDRCWYYLVRGGPCQESSAITQAILMLMVGREQTSVNEDIFDLLLDNFPFESYMSLILFTATYPSLYCTKKLLEKGARLDIIDDENCYVWSRIASRGNVELLDCMFHHGIDKDTTDQNGLSVLWYVVDSRKIEAVRYLLDLGVDIPTYTPEARVTQCDQCKENMLIMDHRSKQEDQDPCMNAIRHNMLDIVKLLEEHGSQTCKSFNALRCAVTHGCVEVASYLLNKYKYHLNMKYIKVESDQSGTIFTLLTELRCKFTALITKLLLDHGADPAKAMCSATSANALMTAIAQGQSEVVAQYIRSGVDINFRSYDHPYKNVLPFEASVLRGFYNAAKMFLISGCSYGVLSLKNNHKFKNNLKPEVEKLMREWMVQENNVTPLMQRCRSVILNHLSPKADIKIEKLPLPKLLIKFLTISDINDILEA